MRVELSPDALDDRREAKRFECRLSRDGDQREIKVAMSVRRHMALPPLRPERKLSDVSRTNNMRINHEANMREIQMWQDPGKPTQAQT